MDKNSVLTLKGFRDITPEQKYVRDVVEQTLVNQFKKYNFVGLETPTLEYQSLLLGKYGSEADKLVYKFKDNGDRDVALRYDQTVPTARYILNNFNNIPKYFRRYQIQNVFRSEKPQKGRYREFKQCDIDIYGSNSPIADAEILSCVYSSFIALNINNIVIKINDRNLLVNTIQSIVNNSINVFSVIQSIDKLDKLTTEEVIKELEAKGLSKQLSLKVINELKNLKIPDSLNNIIDAAVNLGVNKNSIQFDPYLARGLDYYTGFIFEVKIKNSNLGSLGGGGRYNNLINQLVGKKVPATGFAFGFDRIVEYLDNKTKAQNNSYLVATFNDSSLNYSLNIATKLRKLNNNVEIYPQSNDKLTNQIKYAISNNFKYLVIAGQQEMEKNEYIIKDLLNKEQKTIKV